MKKVSILELAEDLLKDDPIQDIPKGHMGIRKVNVSKANPHSRPISIATLIIETTQVLGIDPQELHEWSDDTPVPTEVLKKILLTAKSFKLNPHLGHIAWETNEENAWCIYIPIDGWIELIHREPTFQGLSFNQAAETENAIPIWMECTIYCSDLNHPVTVREYYTELKTDHPIWQQMPRRMLRHKTLQQCARLAFRINDPELKISIKPSIAGRMSASNPKQSPLNRKALLRQKIGTDKF